jgi:hypothetical protein
VETSNQPIFSRPAATISPQWLMKPLTRQTWRRERDLAQGHLRRVVGQEDVRLAPGAGAVGGQPRARVAGGRHGHARDAERLQHRHGDGEAARVEAAGRHAALVLDQDLAAAERAAERGQRQQRRLRLAQADDVGGAAERQQLAPAPHVGGAARQRVARHGAADGGKVVADEQRLARARGVVQPGGVVPLAGGAAFGWLTKQASPRDFGSVSGIRPPDLGPRNGSSFRRAGHLRRREGRFNRPGDFSSFTFRLPRSHASSRRSAILERREAPEFRRIRSGARRAVVAAHAAFTGGIGKSHHFKKLALNPKLCWPSRTSGQPARLTRQTEVPVASFPPT